MRLSRILLSLPFLCASLPTTVRAQYALSRGRVLFSGQASYSRTTSKLDGAEADPQTVVSLTPGAQYFVVTGLATGAQAVYQHASQGETSSTLLGIGPAVSYYFGPAVRRFHPYVSGGVYVGRTDAEAPGFSLSTSSTGFQGGVGFLLLFSRTAGINAQLFYQVVNSSGGGSELDSRVLGVGVGISAFAF